MANAGRRRQTGSQRTRRTSRSTLALATRTTIWCLYTWSVPRPLECLYSSYSCWVVVFLCLQVVVFFSVFFFFQTVVLKCLPHPLRGGTTVFSSICFFLFLCLDLSPSFFVFPLYQGFFSLSMTYNMYVVPVVSSVMTWHGIVLWAYCVPYNIVSLWRSIVTT